MTDRAQAVSWLLLSAAACLAPALATAQPTQEPAYRLERPAAGSGQRGLVSVPPFVVWGGGVAIGLLAAGTLWRLSARRRSGPLDTR